MIITDLLLNIGYSWDFDNHELEKFLKPEETGPKNLSELSLDFTW